MMLKSIISISIVILSSVQVLAAIPERGQKNFKDLLTIASNNSLPMSQRWDSVITATQVANHQEIKEILKFAKHKDWYMRNAVLVALDKQGTDLVYDYAKALVNDKALVVRSAAIEILSRLDTKETRSILIKEVNKNYNFVGQKSLWIRSQILKSLVKAPLNSEKEFYAKLLFDRDKEMSNLSIAALERITNLKFEGENKISDWQKYVKSQKWF